MRASECTYEVPCAGTVRVSTLVTSKLVDQNTVIAVKVSRAAAASGGAAARNGGAVGLGFVGQFAGLTNEGVRKQTRFRGYDGQTVSSQVQAPLGKAHWKPG